MVVLINRFSQIAAELRPAVADIVDQTADMLVIATQNQIQANGQVDTGFMLNGIHKEDGDDDLSKNIMSDADYWKYQNYGTRYIPARPFVEPACDLVRPLFEAWLAGIFTRLGV